MMAVGVDPASPFEKGGSRGISVLSAASILTVDDLVCPAAVIAPASPFEKGDRGGFLLSPLLASSPSMI